MKVTLEMEIKTDDPAYVEEALRFAATVISKVNPEMIQESGMTLFTSNDDGVKSIKLELAYIDVG